MDKSKAILNDLHQNTEMMLVQGAKVVESVDNLEPIMEGVLLKLDEISQKTGEIKVENLTVPVDMSETNQLLTELMDEVKKKDEETYDLQIDDVTREKLKGDKGDSYVLNEDDKKEIASLIDVPIVEKIIEKQPIVTNEIKEVAKKDTAKEIKNKLESLKVGLDYEKLSNLPDIAKIAQIVSQKATKTYALAEMEDVRIGSQTNGQALIWSANAGKWIPGAASGGITTIGTIDSQTPSANGAVISGTELVMQSASTTVPGLVNVGAQSWTGTKSVEKTATSVSATDTAIRAETFVDFSASDTVDALVLGSIGYLGITDAQDHLYGTYVGVAGNSEHAGIGTVAQLIGSGGSVTNTGGGTITDAIGVAAFVWNDSGTITNAYGFKTLFLSGTNTYGFYNDIAGSVNVFTRTHILAGDAIRFYDTDNSHYTGIAANGTTTASIDYTLPAAGPAGDGYALVSTMAGVMSWVANPGAWSLTGNAGTTAGTNFIGTTDAVDLVFKRNSVEQARFVADQLTLKPSAGTYNITTSADTDTITFGVVGVTTQSQFSTSKDLISMKYIGTVPTMAAGVEASVNGLVFYNGSSGLWLWPQVDSTGTQALVSDGSGVLSWATVGVGTVTSVDASGGTTGLSFSGGPITTSGTLTLGGTLALANGGTGNTTGLPINNLIAATGTNTINNANYAQAWQWNSLTTQTALGLSSSSNTSGALLSLSSTSTAVTTNTGMLNVSYSGTPSTSGQTTYAIYANNNVVGNTGQVRYGVRGGVSGGTLFAGGGTGIGGLFTSSTTGTAGYGVQGTVSGQLASGAYGVYGSSTASSSAGAHGVYGISTGSSLGYGTYGSASNTSGIMYGSYGIATTTLNGGNSYGGRFRAVANTSGSSSFSYGVYGEAVTTGNGTAYGGYFSTTEVSTNNIAAYFTATGGTNNYGIIVANGRTGFGITAPTAFVHEVQPVSTTGSPTALLVAGGAHTTLTASTEATDINLNLARTVQFATGALTTQRAMRIQAPTYGFVGASTITDAYTVAIGGAPVAGTNATITRSWALAVQSGNTQLAGSNYLGATGVAPTAFAHIAAGTTAQAQIRLTPGVAPTTPNDGDVYYIDTNDRFMVRKNTLDSEIISASAVTTELVVSDTTLTITYNGVTYKLLAVA